MITIIMRALQMDTYQIISQVTNIWEMMLIKVQKRDLLNLQLINLLQTMMKRNKIIKLRLLAIQSKNWPKKLSLKDKNPFRRYKTKRRMKGKIIMINISQLGHKKKTILN